MTEVTTKSYCNTLYYRYAYCYKRNLCFYRCCYYICPNLCLCDNMYKCKACCRLELLDSDYCNSCKTAHASIINEDQQKLLCNTTV